MNNTKITFNLIDGKSVPCVWTMPEPYNEKDYSGDQWKERAGLDIYNKAITHAKANMIPVKEDFIWQVEKVIRKQYWNELNILPLQKFEADLTRDYDVDMEFDKQFNCPNVCVDADKCKTSGCQCEVAIPKQTKEVEPDDFVYKPNYTSEKKYKVEPVKEKKEQTLYEFSEDKARKIKHLADQIDKERFVLHPEWSEEEYILVSTIWKIFKKGGGTSSKKIIVDEIRKAVRNNFLSVNPPTESGEGKQENDPIAFATWYSGMNREKVLMGYIRWSKEIGKQLESVAPTDEGQEELIREVISEWSKLPGKPGCMERVKSKFRISRI